MIQFYLLILVLLVLILPGAAFIWVLILRGRVADLQDRLALAARDHQNLVVRIAALTKRIVRLEGGALPVEEAPTPPAPEPAKPAPPPPPKQVAPPPPPASARPAPPPLPRPPLPKPPSLNGAALEKQLGTRVTVWLGAIALTLAGAFLVKYTFDRGLITPAFRVSLGLAFGVGLLASAEWMRRRSAGIAQGLAASGVAVLFASLLAGVNLYELIPVSVGFSGMALTTAVAVVLSIRHGQLVAILGLLGGFLTPIWVGSDRPAPWMLLFYLLMLQGGLLVVSRRMRWWPVAGLTLVGAMGWALLWIADLANMGGGSMPVGLFLLASVASFVISAGVGLRSDRWGNSRVSLGIVWSGVGAGVVLMASLVGVGGFGLMEWAFFGLLGAGCLVLGRVETRYEPLAWLAGLAGVSMLAVWGSGLLPEHRLRFLWISVVLGALYAGGSYLAIWGSARPDRWAALSCASGVLYLLVAYHGLETPDARIPWGVVALVLAVVFTLLARPVALRRESLSHGEAALAGLAVAVTLFISLGVPMELERSWITVAWAVEIPALAWIATRLRVGALSRMAWILGAAVSIRLLLNPGIFDYPIGERILFNWLLYGYGVPIAAFAAGAAIFRRIDRTRLATALEVGAMALGFAFLTLQIRQYFHPGNLNAGQFPLSEWGAFTVVWLLYGMGLLTLHSKSGRTVHRAAGLVAGGLALAQGLMVQGLFRLPFFHAETVGETPVFNRLLFVYGLPAVLAAAAAFLLDRRKEKIAAVAAGTASLVLAFLTLTLEVRQFFHGGVLKGVSTTNGEMYTYSLVWILFATALLVAGIFTRGVVLRYGSAVVMLLAVGKVFLVDTANLKDLYRVFSLLGLGVCLMLLAFLYQKFVFGERRS